MDYMSLYPNFQPLFHPDITFQSRENDQVRRLGKEAPGVWTGSKEEIHRPAAVSTLETTPYHADVT
jgi:hypothetical protein